MPAAVSLSRRTRHAGVAVILATGAIFAALKARLAWFAALSWSASEQLRTASGIAVTIDRYAFWLAVMVGIAGFFHIDRRALVTLDSIARKHFRCCF
jgi:hypothetical protein